MSDSALRVTIGVLSLAGIAIATYLTIAKLSHTNVVCATGGCETVQSSRYAELGSIPISAFGIAFYVVVGASAVGTTELIRLGGAAVGLAGAAVAAYLVYLQLVVLDAICTWCVASDAITVVLAAATLVRALSRGERVARPA